jgi:phosphate transport system permease protein
MILENNKVKPKTLKPMKKFNVLAVFEWLAERVFFLCAMAAVFSVAAITIFIFIKGVPAIQEIGLFNFTLGTKWKPSAELYGILPMITGSILATIGAIVIGVPVGLFTAVYLSEIASPTIIRIVKPAVELLAGIPSVLYGFFGLVVIVPLVSDVFGGSGYSLLTASFILGVMILPTIISLSEAALNAVPREFKEGALALGSSHINAVFTVLIPAAKSGIVAAIILGVGRAIGETMAVMLVAGNTPRIPGSILDPIRTMTTNIAMEMNYAVDLHFDALFGTGVVLFVFIMILNFITYLFVHRNTAK